MPSPSRRPTLPALADTAGFGVLTKGSFGAQSPSTPDAAVLAWLVCEPWPSPSTGAELTAGVLGTEDAVAVRVESDSRVVFGDGMESDRLTLAWGQELRIQCSARVLRTVA